MTFISTFKYAGLVILTGLMVLTFNPDCAAQRMAHRGGGGMSRPAARPAPSRQMPSTRPTPSARPAPSPRPAPSARPAPSTGNRGSINGGSIKAPDRSAKLQDRQPSRPTTGSRDINKGNIGDHAGNKGNIGSGNKGNNVGNKVNIGSGNTNINVNINNNRNTVVRHNSWRPYPRPPYYYGGFHYYCYHPYFYHPYRPFYWGPYWHPWGFFVATLTATAIIVTVNSQQYHYDQGVYYVQSDGGYTVVQAPVGATIKVLPEDSETVQVNETTNNYYYGGTYYEKSDGGYTVVPPTAGVVVTNLPEGAEEVRVGDQTYVKYGETYYQPVQVEGDDRYEVADVQPADDDASEGN